MSDQTTHTDAVEETQHTDAAEEVTNTPSTDEEVTDTADNQLDYDQLLSTGKRTKEARNGLSRKEYREAQAEELEPEYEDEPSQMEELNRRMDEKFDKLESLMTEESRKKTAKDGFNRTLTEHGVDASSFKGAYQEEYLSEFQELLDAGLSETVASSKALKMVLPKIEAKDNEDRAEGRRKASLPPTQEVINKRLVVKRSQLQSMTDRDYNQTMERVEAGELEIM